MLKKYAVGYAKEKSEKLLNQRFEFPIRLKIINWIDHRSEQPGKNDTQKYFIENLKTKQFFVHNWGMKNTWFFLSMLFNVYSLAYIADERIMINIFSTSCSNKKLIYFVIQNLKGDVDPGTKFTHKFWSLLLQLQHHSSENLNI